jgi:hypothetical protein
MLAHLQDRIARAEASGLAALQDAALRIRSYATGGDGPSGRLPNTLADGF